LYTSTTPVKKYGLAAYFERRDTSIAGAARKEALYMPRRAGNLPAPDSAWRSEAVVRPGLKVLLVCVEMQKACCKKALKNGKQKRFS